jgi:amino-acid N-acetyltransferase
VDEAARGRGCGSRLVAEAERHAARLGVQSLYLLTTTAEDFFRALGYATIARELAPEAIRNTREFSSLCPASSVVMVKRLASGGV